MLKGKKGVLILAIALSNMTLMNTRELLISLLVFNGVKLTS